MGIYYTQTFLITHPQIIICRSQNSLSFVLSYQFCLCLTLSRCNYTLCSWSGPAAQSGCWNVGRECFVFFSLIWNIFKGDRGQSGHSSTSPSGVPVCCSHRVRLGDLYHYTNGCDGNILQVIEKKIELGQQKQWQSLDVSQSLYCYNIIQPCWPH